VDWANPVLKEPLRIEKGCALIPDRPGAGIESNEDAVGRYLADA
jgi:mandelate racemase